MERLETDKFKLEIVGETHLKLAIFTNDEITKEDIPPVLEFMDQFAAPVPVLLIRKGTYSLSVLVQISLYREAKKRIKAMAYVDRNHKDTVLTEIARNTYMKGAKVRSFQDEQDALNWLAQFGHLPGREGSLL